MIRKNNNRNYKNSSDNVLSSASKTMSESVLSEVTENNEVAENTEPEKNAPDTAKEPIVIDSDKATAIYTLWFGLDYGSILTSYAIYNVARQLGKKPYLLEKHPELWGEHYTDRNNIAGKFITKNCDILEVFSDENAKNALSEIRTHIIGSDILWDNNIVGKQTDKYYYLSDISDQDKKKISFGTSLGGHNVEVDRRNDYCILLNKFNCISVKSLDESMRLSDMYYICPEIVLDPVFLCDMEKYTECAEGSVANEIEQENSFIFTYMKNGNSRKKDFILRGNRALMENHLSPLRNFIDINRFPESRAAIGLEPAFHILADDWLHYIINSDFVITDDYYGMCFALMFEKNFAVLVDRETENLSLYTTLLEQLKLSERLVFTDDDFMAKEYLFRKPVKYKGVSEKLEKLRTDSLNWFKNNLG